MRQATIGALCAVILIAAVASATAPPGQPAAVEPAAVSGTGVVHVYFDQRHVGVSVEHDGCTLVGIPRATDDGDFEAKVVDGTRVETCELEMSFAMSPTLKSWLRNQFAGRSAPRTISLVRTTTSGTPAAALTLTNAGLVGFRLPGVQTARDELATFHILLGAADSSRPPASGFAPPASFPNPSLSTGDFELRVDDVLRPVVAVSSIQLERTFDGSAFGPWISDDLEVQTTRAAGPAWDAWYESVVVQRKDDERTVRLDLLKPNRTVGASFTFGGAAVIAADGNVDNPTDKAARRTFRAYVETMALLLP